MANLTNQVQSIAKHRVSIKRQLRLSEVAFNNNDSTEVLQTLLDAGKNEVLAENEVWVTFDKFSPIPHLRCKAIKTVKQYTERSCEAYTQVEIAWESVSYLIDGQYYGEEFFVKSAAN